MSLSHTWLSKIPHLRISLLGQIAIELEEQPLSKVPSPKISALLAYLLCNPGSHSREHLANLLWDDIPQARFLANLRSTLNRLPKVFKPYIQVTRQTVTFEPTEDIWVDVLVFQQLADALPKTNSRTSDAYIARLSNVEKKLIAMATQYRGSFLDGLQLEDAPRFSDWQFIQQQHLERLALNALQCLVELCVHQGRYADGIAYARRIVALDPLDEEARQYLMVLLARNNDQQAALQEYQALAKMLDEELDVPPSPETVADYERVVAMDQPDRPIQSKLPTLAEPTVGRQQELAALTRQLQMPDCHLLTIIGLGGIGKTHLALEVTRAMEKNRDFLQGVVYIPLATLQSAERLSETIVQGLNLVVSQEDPLTQICNYLKTKDMLILLDNFDHLLEPQRTENRGKNRTTQTLSSIEIIWEILQSAPQIKILVTSRQPLRLQPEYLFPLAGMAFPQEDHELALPDLQKVDALCLFQQVALRNDPDFELTQENQRAVIQFCRLVQGAPLALVLGAAHMEFLTPDELLAECQENLDILETEWANLPERQRSIRAVFEHSWQRLDEPLKKTFCKLTVFRGFTSKAARQVGGASITQLKRLCSQSLIMQTDKGRYEIHELLRQFGETKLVQTGERPSLQEKSVRNQHMQFYLNWLSEQADRLQGLRPQDVLAAAKPDFNNIRQAWLYGVEQLEVLLLAKSRESLFFLYDLLGLHKEGLEIFTHAIQHLEPQIRSLAEPILTEREVTLHYLETLALLMTNQAYFHLELGHYDQTLQQVKKAIHHAQSLPDKSTERYYAQGLGYWVWGWGLLSQSDFQAAYTKADQSFSLGQDSTNQTLMADSLHLQGLAHLLFGQYDAALEKYEQAHTIYTQTQNRRRELENLERLGELKLALGQLKVAKSYFEQALQISQEIDTVYNSYRLSYNLCRSEIYMGEYVNAERRGQDVLRFFKDSSVQWMMATSHYHLGLIYIKMGLYEVANEHLDQALQLYRTMNMRDQQVNCLVNLSVTYCGLGNGERALILLKEAENIADELDSEHLQGYVFKVTADVLNQRGQVSESIILYKQALAFYPSQPEYRKIEVTVGLANALLQSKDMTVAGQHIENLLFYLEHNPEKIQMFINPFEVYLNSYQVLNARKDKRAQPMLDAGYALLQSYAERIDNPEWRRSFLENIAANREIVRLKAETTNNQLLIPTPLIDS